MNANISGQQPKSDIARAIRKRFVQVIGQFLLIAAILFIASGRLDWVWAWAYIAMGVGLLLINAFVMPPELIAERGEPKEGIKGWDRLITSLLIITGLAIFIMVGLDERFGWSPQLAPAIHIAALVVTALAQLFFTWAMVANKFFSTAVRIQIDRGHTVATGGPYRYVRHPGYAAISVTWFAVSLALGSLWAFIPAVLSLCLYVVRTALEDRTLQDELEGYKEYAQRVRYRLLPGVW